MGFECRMQRGFARGQCTSPWGQSPLSRGTLPTQPCLTGLLLSLGAAGVQPPHQCQDLGFIIPPSPQHVLEVLSAPSFCVQRQSGGTSQAASKLMVSMNNLILSSTELDLGYPSSSENCQLLDQLSSLPHPRPRGTRT